MTEQRSYEHAARNGLQAPLAVPCLGETVAETAVPPPTLDRDLHAKFSYDPPSSLVMPDPDGRDRSDPRYIDHRDMVLRPDIRKRGIQVPLLAFLRKDGRKQLFEGGTRLESALLDGLAEVPVMTYAAMPDRRKATFLANENRLDWSPAERGHFYLDTMRQEGWTQALMCRNIPGLKPSRVCKTLKWLEDLPEQYHDKVGEGDGFIPERGAYTVCDFPAEQRADLCEKFCSGLMTVDLLEKLRDKIKGDVKNAKAKPLKLKCDGVQMVISNPTLNGIQAFAEKLMAAIRKLTKDNDSIDFLGQRLKGA